MDIYKLNDFEFNERALSRGNTFRGTKKENDESFYIKAMLPNQLINLIIANPLFRMSLGEDLIPEISVAMNYSLTPPKPYSITKGINLYPAYNLAHIGNGVHCSGGGWDGGCSYRESNIGYNNPNCINSEKGGLATILFQDSDHHIDNEAYIKKGDKYYYIRLDIDHADMVYNPLLSKVINLKDSLSYYGFSCNALKILPEFITEREAFKQSILHSLEDISQIFSDERIHNIYQGLERFKASYDTSEYYHPLEISGNEELSKLVLSNFDLVFDYAQNQLSEINANHSFMLRGVICNPQEDAPTL